MHTRNELVLVRHNMLFFTAWEARIVATNELWLRNAAF